MKGKKIIFLTLALLLPVAVFIFLKIFGRNEFQVPILHQEGDVVAPGNCNFQYKTPYRVADSVIVGLQGNGRDSLYVFYFDPGLNTAMKRISVEFAAGSVRVVGPGDLAAKTDHRIFRECVLLMDASASVALVDHKRRIRGYYDGADRDEVDRLIVEMKIILKQY